jgi:hypothetical protein
LASKRRSSAFANRHFASSSKSFEEKLLCAGEVPKKLRPEAGSPLSASETRGGAGSDDLLDQFEIVGLPHSQCSMVNADQ